MNSPARYLSRNDIERLCEDLDIEAAISTILIEAANNEAGQAVRSELVPSGIEGVLGIMPAYRSGNAPRFAAKVVCVMFRNAERNLPPHQGLVTLFDGSDGHILLMAEAGAVTAARTAAQTALATRVLASDKAERALIVGAGHQALAHLQALSKIPSLKSFGIWARRHDAAVNLQAEALHRGLEVELYSDLEAAVRDADIVTTVTGASDPILQADWLKEGAHLNAIGSSTPKVCEFGPDVVQATRIFVDHKASALSLAGEFTRLATPPDVTEIGQVLAAKSAGRISPSQKTLFKSVGAAVQDLAMMDALLTSARERAVGQTIEL